MSTNEQKVPDTSALAKIRAGEVRMRSKLSFILRAVASLIAALLILVLSSVIISFVLFSLRETGQSFLLGFGGRGILAFLFLFPWPFLSVDLALLFLLDWLVREWSVAYRFSMASVFGVLALVSVALALLINATAFHLTLQHHADRGDLPIAGPLYEDSRDPHHELGIFRGTVESIGTSSFVMIRDSRDQDADDRPYVVYFSPATPLPLDTGTRVFVFGSPIGSSTIKAEQVRVFLPQP